MEDNIQDAINSLKAEIKAGKYTLPSFDAEEQPNFVSKSTPPNNIGQSFIDDMNKPFQEFGGALYNVPTETVKEREIKSLEKRIYDLENDPNNIVETPAIGARGSRVPVYNRTNKASEAISVLKDALKKAKEDTKGEFVGEADRAFAAQTSFATPEEAQRANNIRAELANHDKTFYTKNGHLSDLWSGLKKLDVLDTVTLGWSDTIETVSRAAKMRGIANKTKNGQALTSEEQAFADAYSELMKQEYYQELSGGTGIASSMGEAVAVAPQFLGQMVLTGGIGNVAAAGAGIGAKAAAKMFGKEAVEAGAKKALKDMTKKEVAAKGVKFLADNAISAVAQTPFQNLMYKDYAERELAQYSVTETPEGNLSFELTNPESAAIRLYKSFMTAGLEIYSEGLGDGLGKGVKYIGAKRLGEKMAANEASGYILGKGSSKVGFAKAVEDFKGRAKFDGFLYEMAEEEFNMVAQPLLTGDESQLTDPSAHIKTALSVAAMSASFKMAEIPSYVSTRYGKRKSLNAANASLAQIQDESLRQQVSTAMGFDKVTDREQALDNLDWSTASLEDRKFALTYMKHKTEWEVLSGAVNTAEHQDKLEMFDGIAQKISTPEGKATVLIDKDGNSFFGVGGEYNGIKKDADGNSSFDFKSDDLVVMDAQGNYKTIPASSIQTVNEYETDNLKEEMFTEWQKMKAVEKETQAAEAQASEVSAMNGGVNLTSPTGKPQPVVAVGDVVAHEDGKYRIASEDASTFTMLPVDEEGEDIEDGTPAIVSKAEVQRKMEQQAAVLQAKAEDESTDDVTEDELNAAMASEGQLSQEGGTAFIDNGTPDAKSEIPQPAKPTSFEIEVGTHHLTLNATSESEFKVDRTFRKSDIGKAEKLISQLNEDYEDKGITFELRQNEPQSDNPFEPTTFAIHATLPVKQEAVSEPVIQDEVPQEIPRTQEVEQPVSEEVAEPVSSEAAVETEQPIAESVEVAQEEAAPVADAEFIAQEYPLAFALLNQFSKEEGQALSPSNVRIAVMSAYSTQSVTAEQVELLKQLEAVNTLVNGNQAANLTTKADMLESIAAHEGMTQEQKELISNMVEALAVDNMPLLQDSSQQSKQNFYTMVDNLVSISDANAFSHEIGHWGFFNVLNPEERIQFMQGLTPKKRRKKADLAESLVFGKPIRSGSKELRSNAATSVQEYFAEQFMQYVAGANTKSQNKALFAKLKDYLDKIVALFSIKGYNKELQPYFEKIVDKNYLAALNYQLSVDNGSMSVDQAQAELADKGLNESAELLAAPEQVEEEPEPEPDPETPSPQPPAPRRKPVGSGDLGALFSQVAEQPTNIEGKLLVDNGKHSRDAYQMRFQDRMLPARKLVEIMKEQGVMNDSLDFYLAENRSQSAAKHEITQYDKVYFKPVLNFISNLNRDYGVSAKETSDYLLAKHSLERHNDPNSVNALSEDPTSDWTVESVTEIINRYEDKLNSVDPQLVKDLWKRVNAATSYALKASMGTRISKEQLEEYLNRYEYYVPLRGWEFDKEKGEVDPMEFFRYDLNGRFEGGRKSVSATTQAKGRITKPADPLGYIQTIANQAIAIKHNDKVLLTFLNAVRANRDMKEYVQLTKLWTIDLDGNPYETTERPTELLEIQKKALAYHRANEQRKKLLKRIAKRNDSIDKMEEKNGKPFSNNVRKQLLKELNDKLKEVESKVSDLMQETNELIYTKFPNGSAEQKTAYFVGEKGFEGERAITVDGSVKGNRKVGEQYNKQHEVEIYDNGVRYVVRTSDQQLAEALNGTQDQSLWGFRPQDTVIGSTSRYLASAFTSKNPAFIPVNHVRDLIQASITIGGDIDNQKTLGRFYKQYRPSRSSIVRQLDGTNNPLTESELSGYDLTNSVDREYLKGTHGAERYYDTMYALFQREGGETGYVHFKDVKELQKDIDNEMKVVEGWTLGKVRDGVLAHTKLKAASDAIERQGTIVENTTRFAAFLMSMENSESVVQSISYAKNISVNFNRKGTKSSGLGALYLFFNAGVQGNYQLYKNAKNNKMRFAMALSSLAAISASLTFFSMFLSVDDDEASSAWDRLPDFDKANNIMIWCGGERFIKIPLPQGYRTIHNMVVQSIEVLNGKKSFTEGLSTVFGQFIGDTSPIDIGGLDPLRALTPTALTPLVDIAKNETFSGAKVFREAYTKKGEKYTPESEMGLTRVMGVFQQMSRALNWLGGGDKSTPAGFNQVTGEYNYWLNKLDINPSVLEHVAFYYLGGIGTVVKDAIKTVSSLAETGEASANTLPVVRRFLSTSAEDLNYYLLYQKKAEPYQNYMYFWQQNLRDGNVEKLSEQMGNKGRLRNAVKVETFDSVLNDMNGTIATLRDNGMNEQADKLVKKRKEFLKKSYNSLEHSRDL